MAHPCMALRRRSASEALNPWPGYVDALSTLLMVIIFVLLVFVLAQAFLSVALTGRDRALDRLNRQMAELSDMLSLERGRSAELRSRSRSSTATSRARPPRATRLAQQLAALRGEQDRLGADRDALKADRDRLSARLADADLQAQSAAARAEQLQRPDRRCGQARRPGRTGGGARPRAQLAEARAAARGDAAPGRRSSTRRSGRPRDDRGPAVRPRQDGRAGARADRAARRARAAGAGGGRRAPPRRRSAARPSTRSWPSEQQARRQRPRADRVADPADRPDARAARRHLGGARQPPRRRPRTRTSQIANLGSRLNAALAQHASRNCSATAATSSASCARCWPTGRASRSSATASSSRARCCSPSAAPTSRPAGQDQIERAGRHAASRSRARSRKDVNWLLRVDGHADRQPVDRGRFGSNWELSAGRAITRGQAADRRRHPAEPAGRDRLCRQPAARSSRHAGSLCQEPPDRDPADGSLTWQTVVITGAAGSIGRKLRAHFAALGWTMRLLDCAGRRRACKPPISRNTTSNGPRRSPGADAVIHLAGDPSPSASLGVGAAPQHRPDSERPSRRPPAQGARRVDLRELELGARRLPIRHRAR